VLRLHAAKEQDTELMDESGFKPLVDYLLHKVVAQSDDLDRHSTRNDVLSVADQLSSGMKAELAILEDPEKVNALVEDLTKAKARADELKQRSSRWQITLNDGVADLQSDIGFDLRDRLRTIGREAEQLIDDSDPAEVWEQFSDWFHQQISSAASANFVWAAERARWLSGQVAEHFAEGAEISMPELRFDDEGIAGKVDQLERPEVENLTRGGQLLTGLKGGYGGMLMFGMMGTFAGLPIFAGAPAGVLMGIKAVRDEKKRMLQKRRGDAKTGVRKHIDEVTFQVGKDSTDMLRRTQRQLRDHFSALADEMSTSISASVQAAQNALKTNTSGREKRIRDLKAELSRIDGMAQRAKALVSDKRATALSGGAR
jgi:hypothetical protein